MDLWITLSHNSFYITHHVVYTYIKFYGVPNCYKDFTVKVNGELVFEQTPVSMIKTVRLKNKSAYVYEPEVNYLKGGISRSKP